MSRRRAITVSPNRRATTVLHDRPAVRAQRPGSPAEPVAEPIATGVGRRRRRGPSKIEAAMDVQAAYLDLLKLALIDALGHRLYKVPATGAREDPARQLGAPDGGTRHSLQRHDDDRAEAAGPSRASASRAVLAEDIPGDLIEAGVWRGGAGILMRAVLDLHGSDRTVWMADSFQRLPRHPRADPEPPHAAGRGREGELREVRAGRRSGVRGGVVRRDAACAEGSDVVDASASTPTCTSRR